MNQYHNYIFLNEINDQLTVRIKKIKNVSIIYYIDDFESFNENLGTVSPSFIIIFLSKKFVYIESPIFTMVLLCSL